MHALFRIRTCTRVMPSISLGSIACTQAPWAANPQVRVSLLLLALMICIGAYNYAVQRPMLGHFRYQHNTFTRTVLDRSPALLAMVKHGILAKQRNDIAYTTKSSLDPLGYSG